MYPSRHSSSGSARGHLLAAAAAAAAHRSLTASAAHLPKVIVQDKWKDGARNTVEGGGRKVGACHGLRWSG